MRIQYVGAPEQVVIKDIYDPRFNGWAQGEVKDVPEQDVAVNERFFGAARINAIQAVFSAGFGFVDAETGKNPLYTCVRCGDKADHDFFRHGEHIVEYTDAKDGRLCVPCFLAEHPQHQRWHIQHGFPVGLQNLVAERVKANAPEPPASVRIIEPPRPAEPVPAPEEDAHA